MFNDIKKINNYFILYYENLIRKPQESLKEILKFLSLPLVELKLNVDKTSNAKYFEMWHNVFLNKLNRDRPVPSLTDFYNTKTAFWQLNYKRLLKTYFKKKVFGDERQMSVTSFEAQDAVAVFEEEINQFGYSLLDVSKYPSSNLQNNKA